MREHDQSGRDRTDDKRTGPPSRLRFAIALALGHISAIYAFCVSLMLLSALPEIPAGLQLLENSTGRERILEGILIFPLTAGAMSLFGAVLMAPLTLLLAPIAYVAATRLRTGAVATGGLGSVLGLLTGVAALASPVFWGEPPVAGFDASFWATTAGAAACAGAVFAYIVWLVCIRPARKGVRLPD
jgi:hypothetical protein